MSSLHETSRIVGPNAFQRLDRGLLDKVLYRFVKSEREDRRYQDRRDRDVEPFLQLREVRHQLGRDDRSRLTFGRSRTIRRGGLVFWFVGFQIRRTRSRFGSRVSAWSDNRSCKRFEIGGIGGDATSILLELVQFSRQLSNVFEDAILVETLANPLHVHCLLHHLRQLLSLPSQLGQVLPSGTRPMNQPHGADDEQRDEKDDDQLEAAYAEEIHEPPPRSCAAHET